VRENRRWLTEDDAIFGDSSAGQGEGVRSFSSSFPSLLLTPILYSFSSTLPFPNLSIPPSPTP
jgi:hypothetical protein